MALNTSLWIFWNDLNRPKYEEIYDLPFMSSVLSVGIIMSAYLIFVLKVGPDFMRDRKPYNLKAVLLIYNVVQVIISAYIVQVYFGKLLKIGITPRKCFVEDPSMRKQILSDIWIYVAAKASELLDTVFFVLRKKQSQVSFLHIYHHAIMFTGCWSMLKYFPSDNLYFMGTFNSAIHVIMYTYYGLAALGPEVNKYLTWKRHLTKLQLAQFILCIIQYIYSIRVSECPPTNRVAVFISGNIVLFLILFLNFYGKTYRRNKGPRVESMLKGSANVLVNSHSNEQNGVERQKNE